MIIISQLLILNIDLRNAEKLYSRSYANELMIELSKVLDMTPMHSPMITQFPDPGGISGIITWKESHASMHTYPEYKHVSFDIDSCRPFSNKKAVDLIIEKLPVNHIVGSCVTRYDKQHIFSRGIESDYSLKIESFNERSVT